MKSKVLLLSKKISIASLVNLERNFTQAFLHAEDVNKKEFTELKIDFVITEQIETIFRLIFVR